MDHISPVTYPWETAEAAEAVEAAAVAAALIDGGLERLSVSWEGVGSAEPVIIGGVEDKVMSRRVEIFVLAA